MVGNFDTCRKSTSFAAITLLPQPGFPWSHSSGVSGFFCNHDLIFSFFSSQEHVPGNFVPSSEIVSKICICSISSTLSQETIDWNSRAAWRSSSCFTLAKLCSRQFRTSWRISEDAAIFRALASWSINAPWRSKFSIILSKRRSKRPHEVRNRILQP